MDNEDNIIYEYYFINRSYKYGNVFKFKINNHIMDLILIIHCHSKRIELHFILLLQQTYKIFYCILFEIYRLFFRRYYLLQYSVVLTIILFLINFNSL